MRRSIGMAGSARRDPNQLPIHLAHLYRGEISLADTWRARLDNTSNWALTATAAVVSVGLQRTVTHAVFLAGMYLVTNFLLIESRRYRVWDVYMRRLRILETSLYVPLLRDEILDSQRLRELASFYENPRLQISFGAALGQRLKRAYAAYYGVLLVGWIVKLSVAHQPGESLGAFLGRMHVGIVPGVVVLLVVLFTYGSITYALVRSLLLGPPRTEFLPLPRHAKRPLALAFEAAGHNTPGGAGRF